MIRVLVVDDHHAMRRGLENVLAETPDLIPVAAGSGEGDLWHLLKRTAPDVVLLDYHLPGQDGLMLCHRIKNLTLPPAVVIYSAYADESLEIAATVAGADAVLNKSAQALELFATLRGVAAGERSPGTPRPGALNAAASKLEEADRPLLGMLIQRTSLPDVADTLGLPLDEAARRVRSVIGRLRVRVPAMRDGGACGEGLP